MKFRTSCYSLSGASAVLCIFAIWASMNLDAPYYLAFDWLPKVGLRISFRVDSFSLFFVTLICGIGSLVFFFCAGYLPGDKSRSRTLSILLLFTLSMLGLVLSDNVLLLFIFWEFTTITSFFLVGAKCEKKEAREAALQALLVTVAGGMALLVAILLLFMAAGTLELSSLEANRQLIQDSPLYPVILILIAAGAFTKSAQFPFHFWLPGAMTAPSPVSAFLHSATMVKAGIYLLARFHPILGETVLWHDLLIGIGAATMIVGASLALARTDIKALLAYTTVSALGMLTFLLGLGTTLAMKAALVFLLVHACYKAALFMVAGSIEKLAGTRDLDRLHSLGKMSPALWCAAALPALSMCGLPPMLGFIGKELIYEAKLIAPTIDELFLLIGFTANALTVTAALLAAVKPFIPRTMDSPPKRKLTLPLLAPPIILGIVSLACGLFPTWVGDNLLEPSFQALKGEPSQIKLKLWHGVNPVFILSVLTLVTGALIYWIHSYFARMVSVVERWSSPFAPERLYAQLVKRFVQFASLQTRLAQNGSLNFYLTVTLCFASLLLAAAFFSLPEKAVDLSLLIHLKTSLIILGAAAAAVLSIRAQSMLEAVLLLGVVGLGVTLFFVFYGAPDLALTQFLVELLLLVLIASIWSRLPAFRPDTPKREKRRDLFAACILGVFLSYFVLQAVFLNEHNAISEFYAQNAATEAFGRNVVNVILVDFRALDTMGEITVLAIAMMGIMSLLKTRKTKR
ncbi:MAG: DUF4040 domain-containing protein [Candidatus Omnitrophica bacterium]|nr:DUF4040 domain-containing protein [Candidatus Omnitrophota bacterium]